MATKKDTWAGGFWEALTYAWMRRPGIRVVPCTTSKYSISAPGPSSRGQSVLGVEALSSTSVVTHPWARQQQAWRRHMGDDLDLATVVPTEEKDRAKKTVLKTAYHGVRSYGCTRSSCDGEGCCGWDRDLTVRCCGRYSGHIIRD